MYRTYKQNTCIGSYIYHGHVGVSASPKAKRKVKRQKESSFQIGYIDQIAICLCHRLWFFDIDL